MRNSKRKAHISSRRGFTVLEVVIALTVITIVSASAFALIHSHLKLENQSVQSIEATNIAENAIECFRFAKNNNFRETYESVVGTEENSVTLSETNNEDNGVTTYQYKDGDLEVTFEVQGSTIKILVKNGDNTVRYAEYTNKI